MKVLHLNQEIPDGVKVGASVAAPVLNLFGIPVEQWTFILSGIVSVLFIIEKLPMLILRTKALIAWIRQALKK